MNSIVLTHTYDYLPYKKSEVEWSALMMQEKRLKVPNVILMNQNEQEESLYNSTRICMTFADDALIDALPKETFHLSPQQSVLKA